MLQQAGKAPNPLICGSIQPAGLYDAFMIAPAANRIADWLVEYGLKPVAIAIFFVLVALIWTFPLQHVIAYPFVFLFFGAIMGSAWFGGFIAGAWAIGMSTLLIAFFFMPPLYSIAVNNELKSYHGAFIICAIAITAISAARRRTENASKAARDELETRVRERTAELERSNREILERERHLRRLTEAIPQQIWSADETGCIEYCNHDLVQYVGKSSEDLSGEAFFDIFHPEDVVLFRQSWDAARSSGEMLEVQTRIRNAAGAYRWFLVRSIPQQDANGAIAQWYGVHIDIEEQQRAQQRILQAHEEESRFTRTMSMAEMAALIAHELNQPLTALVTHASACRRWLRAEPMNMTRASAAADRMVRDSTRAGAVIDRVRSLIGKSDYVRQPADVNELISGCVRLLRHDSVRRGVSIKLQLADELPQPRIDAVQIQQVVLNLARNGMDAMKDMHGPRILEICSAMQNEATIVVSVRDSGPGFEEGTEQKIFEPFFTTKAKGAGMGLAICRSIVEAHDGRIWAARAEHGTVFQFTLKV